MKIKTIATSAGNAALSIAITTVLQMVAEAAAKRLAKDRSTPSAIPTSPG